MVVTHGDKADRTRCSDGARHVRSRRARIAFRIKKCACGDIASHVSRLMAVCNECLRVGVVPNKSHLVFENKARDSVFCKSQVGGRYRAVATIANDVKHLVNVVGDSSSIPRGHVGRQSRDVQKVREFGDSTPRSGVERRARYG